MAEGEALLPGDVVLRHFRLDAPLGRGGIGEVFRGTDLRTGETVAVKVLRRALAEASTVSARFLREARIARRLDHPAVPRGLAVGVGPRGAPVLVMEFVDGETTRASLDRRGPLPVFEALRIGARVAETLDAAHAASIVHRDIKPENVMLAAGLTAPEAVRVLDFGLAFVLDEPRLSATHSVIGTPEYASPEQCRGERVTRAADVYSLGATLAHLLTGSTLHPGSARAQFEAHLSAPTPDLTARRADLPRPVADYLATMLRKSPAERPGPARAVAEDLFELASSLDRPSLTIAPAYADVTDAVEADALREALDQAATELLASTRTSSAAHARIVEQIVALAAARFELGDDAVSSREESLERALETIQREARVRQDEILTRMRAMRARLAAMR